MRLAGLIGNGSRGNMSIMVSLVVFAHCPFILVVFQRKKAH